MADITRILERIQQEGPKATDELLSLVYDELRRIAAAKMAHEQPGQTLQATALVHEAWLRLAGPNPVLWNGRGHFFAAAAEAMRRILIERARKRRRIRHGGDLERVDLDQVTVATQDTDNVILAVHEALEKLASESATKDEIVKLHYFAGLQNAEIAEVLGVSEPTVRRHWAYARSWLYAELKGQLGK
jgi:RNA polymerase sigma factor (TIGR02999 family)